MGGYKTLERFPLSPEGWASAWVALVELDPEAAEKPRAALKERERQDRVFEQTYGKPAELKELDGRTLVRLPEVALLGGYSPDAPIAIGDRYDARFLDDQLAICAPHDWKVLKVGLRSARPDGAPLRPRDSAIMIIPGSVPPVSADRTRKSISCLTSQLLGWPLFAEYAGIHHLPTLRVRSPGRSVTRKDHLNFR